MAETSHIEWTDATWNPITGCSVVSPGCTNCYAMKLAGTRLRHHPSRAGLTTPTKGGPVWTGETRVNWDWIDQPLSWSRPRRIFVCAHGDLFHESVAWEDIAVIYGVMIAAHHLRGHTLQVLTKRSGRARELLSREDFWEVANAHASAEIMERVDCFNRRSDDARATCDDYGPENPPPGIWLGVSVEDQARADERVPNLLATPAALRFLSCEPLLGQVDLVHIAAEPDDAVDHPLDYKFNALIAGGSCYEFKGDDGYWYDADGPVHSGIDWVICGGESGPGARPMHPDWACLLRDQCAAAEVPFFFKQWGAWRLKSQVDPTVRNLRDYPTCTLDEGTSGPFLLVGKTAAGRLLDGVSHDGMPA